MEASDLPLNTELRDYADSLEFVGVAVAAEQKFNIQIDDADIESIRTIRDLISVVETKTTTH